MSAKKLLLEISYHTDNSLGFLPGETDFKFGKALKDYLKKYGTRDLLLTLDHLIAETFRKNREWQTEEEEKETEYNLSPGFKDEPHIITLKPKENEK